MASPLELGCKCAECPFANAGQSQDRTVQGDGPSKPVGVVFTDTPSRDDARGGVPLQGLVGQEFDQTLEQAGLNREHLYLVPATACPRPEKVPEARTPAAVKACKPWRDAMPVPQGLPRLILGQFAYLAATGQAKGFGGQRGFVDYETKTVVTWRPEVAYFKNPYEWAAFDIDVGRFARAIKDTLVPEPAVVVDGVDLDSLHQKARAKGWVAYDIETAPVNGERPWTGKDPTQARLRTLGFGWGDEGYSFFWNESPESMRVKAKAILTDPRITKVGINVVYFDNRVLLREASVRVAPYFDLRDARRALSSTSRLSLAYLTSLYTDAPAWKASKDAQAEDVTK